MRYCAQQETGGVIQNASEWGNRKWMQLCGVTKEEVMRPCCLWAWDNGDVAVQMYPHAQEKAAQSKRAAGQRFGKGHPKHTKEKTHSSANSSANSTANSSAKDKDKGKDNDKDNGNGKEQPKKPKNGFTPPTIEDVQAYCSDWGHSIDCAAFIDHFTASGWKLSNGNQMKDWLAAVRNWKRNETRFSKPRQQPLGVVMQQDNGQLQKAIDAGWVEA